MLSVESLKTATNTLVLPLQLLNLSSRATHIIRRDSEYPKTSKCLLTQVGKSIDILEKELKEAFTTFHLSERLQTAIFLVHFFQNGLSH